MLQIYTRALNGTKRKHRLLIFVSLVILYCTVFIKLGLGLYLVCLFFIALEERDSHLSKVGQLLLTGIYSLFIFIALEVKN